MEISSLPVQVFGDNTTDVPHTPCRKDASHRSPLIGSRTGKCTDQSLDTGNHLMYLPNPPPPFPPLRIRQATSEPDENNVEIYQTQPPLIPSKPRLPLLICQGRAVRIVPPTTRAWATKSLAMVASAARRATSRSELPRAEPSYIYSLAMDSHCVVRREEALHKLRPLRHPL